MFIKEVLPLSERQYIDKQGAQQVYASRGFILTDGVDTLYAEVSGDKARRTDYKAEQWVAVQMTAHAREYTDKNNQKRYSNEMTITNLGI